MRKKDTLIKPPSLRVLSVFFVIIVVFTLFLIVQSVNKPERIPTQMLDESTSVGGTPVVHDSETETATPPPKVSSSRDTDSTKTESSRENAPRQEEIAEKIKVEYPYKALGTVPNDPYYVGSWLHQRTETENAWTLSTGTPVTIAIIDTGYALDHEDLISQWSINDGESGTTSSSDSCWSGAPQNKSSNGCDDDTNGYVDDWRGWNFINSTNNPQAGTTSEYGISALSHGTAVAGLAGAATNNGIGIASFNWNVSLMPLVALDDDGSGTTTGVVSAIYYAVDNGASIINLSLGGPSSDPALEDAINYAHANNVVVVAAAGNCGTTGDAGCGGLSAPVMMYPARNNHVIAVGASDASDARASFSSYGPSLDVVAPGSGTLTSPFIDSRSEPYNYTNAYSATLYGTSFASPVVSGIASLVRSLRPTSTVDDIIALIDATATKVPGMNGQVYSNQYGHGVINTNTASTIAQALSQSTETAPQLAQTGDHRSEHSFSATAMMSSGCSAPALSYCTVHMRNDLGYDRYLPYTRTSASGSVGWHWSGGILTSGEWIVRAEQGITQSAAPYYLFSK